MILRCLALLLCLAPTLSAQTTTTGTVIDVTAGAPLFTGIFLVRRTTLDALPPGADVEADLFAPTDAQGVFEFSIDDSDPTYNEFYVYTTQTRHLNQIYAGVPAPRRLKESFDVPGVVALDGRQDNAGVDFNLESNFSTVEIAMRDGVRLATDVFRCSPDPGPTILTRTIYGKSEAGAELFTLSGYHVVVQDSRGRFDSEGEDRLFRDDGWGVRQDGFDTLDWIVAQPFSNGDVGMWGGSALAITQYMVSATGHPALCCGYASVGSGSLYEDLFFQGGVFRKHLIEEFLESQGSLHFLPEVEAHPNRDEWWDAVDMRTRLDQINVPFFHLGGWFDLFPEGVTRAFSELHTDGGPGAIGNQKMSIGPWTHTRLFQANQGELVFPPNSKDDGGENWTELAFFDYWLQGRDFGFSTDKAVRYYLMGDVDDPTAPGNHWRRTGRWPPRSTPAEFAFRADGSLESVKGQSPGRTFTPPRGLSYRYDPLNPVPTLGGHNSLLPAGPYDQRPIEQRADVLTFTTEPLTSPLEVVGNVRAELLVSSDALDTDFMVKLCDVYPDGRSMLIAEGALRARHRQGHDREVLLVPGQLTPLTVDLWSTAIVFNAGHRVRVSVTSSNDPRWEPNPNTGEPFRQHSGTFVATNTIHVGGAVGSRIVLPVR